jgi:hypothetical protein
MNTYTLLRLVHGYWRWAVLATAIVVLARIVKGFVTRSAYTPADAQSAHTFANVLDLQVLIGLILYFGFSPFWPATYRTFSETMSGDVARFFGVEHGTAMLLAAATARIGQVRAKRRIGSRNGHTVMLVTMLIFFAVALWAIPWPWRGVGRPLFRTAW